MILRDKKIAVIGLGYVGLPLAVEFGKKYKTIGFDINQARVDELSDGYDHTLEVEETYLQEVIKSSSEEVGISFTTRLEEIQDAHIYIVTVPTPTDKNNRPDLTPLYKASETVGKVLSEGDIVIYESTVYPGVTEDECVPVLEKVSGLKYNEGFYCGYSPERINPGDKQRTVTKILKVTAGSTPEIAEEVDTLYKSVITAGTFKASTIKVAEASKVIENSQRDINIAFVNELAKIFNLLEIDTLEVLEAAGTKWNFLPFRPGLVGGHCIGVDPYYLAQKGQEVGYHPEIILAGRRLNDGMGAYVAQQVINLMVKAGQRITESRVLVLGFTFKENCPDVRNTRVVDIISEMEEFGAQVSIYDPWAEAKEVRQEYKLELLDSIEGKQFDAIVLSVGHNKFKEIDINKLKSADGVVYDVKSFLPKELVDGRL